MNRDQFLDAVRTDLDDETTPYFYSDEELTRWYNNAVAEACIRARLLQDDSSKLTRIAVTAGTARYKFDPSIIGIQAAHISGRTEPLVRCTAAYLDHAVPGWLHMPPPPSTPCYAVLDLQQKALLLFPTPAQDATLYLRTWRKPTENEEMEAGDDEPVITLFDPESLKHWVLHEAYLKKDGELNDPERAAQHLGIFTDRFGERPTEHALMLWSTQVAGRPRRPGSDY